MVSVQPWAVLKPRLLGKRGLDTPDGVTEAVAVAAKRFEDRRPKILKPIASWVGGMSAVLFVCFSVLMGIAGGKKQSSPTTGSQPTTPDTRAKPTTPETKAVVEPTAKKVVPTP